MNLAQLWAGRQWVAILDFIDALPMASRLNEAILNDPDTSEMIARQRRADEAAGKTTEEWSPAFKDFDLHAQLLRDVVQSLAGVQSAVIAAAGGKPKRPKSYPVPKTGVDDAIKRIDAQWAHDMIELFTPGR